MFKKNRTKAKVWGDEYEIQVTSGGNQKGEMQRTYG